MAICQAYNAGNFKSDFTKITQDKELKTLKEFFVSSNTYFKKQFNFE